MNAKREFTEKNGHTRYPVDYPKAMGEGTIRGFVKWHEKAVKKNKNH